MCGLTSAELTESVFFTIRDKTGDNRVVCENHFDPEDIVVHGGCKRLKQNAKVRVLDKITFFH